VYEDIRHVYQLERLSFNYTVPVYWHIQAGHYGTTKGWAGFTLEQCNLIKTSTAKSLLYMEADCTPPGALLFGHQDDGEGLHVEDGV
jgi:hypothetical protein